MTALRGAAGEVRSRAGDLIAYATGSVGMGVWVTVPGLLLLYFLTNTLGVSPFLAGLTLLLPKIIDIIVHPMLGSHPIGRRAAADTGSACCGSVCCFRWPWWRCSRCPPASPAHRRRSGWAAGSSPATCSSRVSRCPT